MSYEQCKHSRTPAHLLLVLRISSSSPPCTSTGSLIRTLALGHTIIVMDQHGQERALRASSPDRYLKRWPSDFPATHSGQSTPKQLYACLYYSSATSYTPERSEDAKVTRRTNRIKRRRWPLQIKQPGRSIC